MVDELGRLLAGTFAHGFEDAGLGDRHYRPSAASPLPNAAAVGIGSFKQGVDPIADAMRAVARLVSADQMASFTSGVTVTFSCAMRAAIHSAASCG